PAHHRLLARPGLARSIPSLAEQPRRAVQEMLLEVEDEHLGIQLLAAHAGGTARGAAPALRAVVEVEQVLPRELGDRTDSEGLGVLQVHGPGLALRGERSEEDVERGGHYVEVLRVREPDQEAEQEHGVE